MRLVVEYEVGDGCTYHCRDTVPVEYESAEAFIVDFEREVLSLKDHYYPHTEFKLGNQTFDSAVFFRYDPKSRDKHYEPPLIFTVDEWFNNRMQHL